jgi:hypothetical protein
LADGAGAAGAGLGVGLDAISSCVEHAETIRIAEMAATLVNELRFFISPPEIRLKSWLPKSRVVYCTASQLVKRSKPIQQII